MRKILFIAICVLFLLADVVVLAHQPRLVESDFALIKNPEVSQAFYGELKGEPNFFQIQADTPIKLYIGILVPDVKNIGKDISVEVSKDDEFYYLLDGENFEWQPYYEEFAGDDYFKGPELLAEERDGLPQGVEAESGIYNLKVYSPDDQGKYILVIGEKEEFPFNEIIKTIVVLPQLRLFFSKSPLTAYFNLIGLFMITFLFFILSISILIFFLVKKMRNRLKDGKLLKDILVK